MPDAKEIIKRHQKALDKKENWRALYEDAYEFCIPNRNLYDGAWEAGQPGQKKTSRLFDSTAVHSTQRFAARIQSALFPPYRRWMRLEPGEVVPENMRESIQSTLDMYSDRFFTCLHNTSFDLAMGEFLLDLAVGTGVMLVQPSDDPVEVLRFETVPPYLVSFDEGPNATVQNVYRRMRLRPENILRTYPLARLNHRLRRALEDAPDEEVELLEATMYDTKRADYKIYLVDPTERETIMQRQIDHSPWIIARYSKVAGEIMGRGPILTALPSIRSLNKTMELLLKNASINVGGVYLAQDDGVLNPQTIDIKPGAIIAVARSGGPTGPSLTPLARAGDIQLSQIILNDLRMEIKRILLDDTLPPDNMSARSATEIAERMRELSVNMGSAFGRLVSEAMVPLVRQTFNVMASIGMVEVPIRVDGREVQVTPVAPLAKTQDMDDVRDVLNFVQVAEQLGADGALVLDKEAIALFIAQKLGVPVSLLVPQQARDDMKAAALEAAEMAAQTPEGAAMVANTAAQGLGGGGGGGPALVDPQAMQQLMAS